MALNYLVPHTFMYVSLCVCNYCLCVLFVCMCVHVFVHVQESLRSVNVPQPDLSYLTKSLLSSYGFYETSKLGNALVQFHHEIKKQVTVTFLLYVYTYL